MKKLITTIALCSTFVCGNALAHSDHGVISPQGAVNIAAKSIKQMTFKDFGFATGKLDASWKDIPSSQITLVTVEDNYYVVSAVNPSTEKQIFLKVANNGNVLDVKDKNEF